MQVVIRADASERIGIGHIMRSLTLADKLQEAGAHIEFICRGFMGNGAELIESRGHAVHLLADFHPDEGNHWQVLPPELLWVKREWQQDCAETIKMIGTKNKPELLIVDHYGIDKRWLKMIRPRVHNILCIDDLADRALDCDIMLDQTYGRVAGDYRQLLPDTCTQLLGTDYALLRPQFAEKRHDSLKYRRSRKRVSKILVCMGGRDANDVTSMVMQGIKDVNWPELPSIDVILGDKAPNLDQVLKEACASIPPIEVHSNVTEMAEFMSKADLAIGAGGTTVWEQMCLGLPVIVISTAANQKEVVAELEGEGAIIHLGKANKISSSHITAGIQTLLDSEDKVRMLSRTASTLIDGIGTERAASEVFKVILGGVKLRLAHKSDCECMLEWQSDPRSRRYSRNTDTPKRTEHETWFAAALKNPLRKLYVVEDQGVAIGVVRLDVFENDSSSGEISILVSPSMNGRGYGRRALIALRLQWPYLTLWAEILRENRVSKKLFTGVGYIHLIDNWYVNTPRPSKIG